MTNFINAETVLAMLRNSDSYTASSDFLSHVGWKNSGYADYVMHKDNGGEVSGGVTGCILIGQVVDDTLFVGASGNYSPKYNELSKAKYRLTIQNPGGEYAADYTTSVERLQFLEDAVARTSDKRNLFIKGATPAETKVRFSAPMFEKRVRPFLILGIISI
jgi:subtilisin family serine protease